MSQKILFLPRCHGTCGEVPERSSFLLEGPFPCQAPWWQGGNPSERKRGPTEVQRDRRHCPRHPAPACGSSTWPLHPHTAKSRKCRSARRTWRWLLGRRCRRRRPEAGLGNLTKGYVTWLDYVRLSRASTCLRFEVSSKNGPTLQATDCLPVWAGAQGSQRLKGYCTMPKISQVVLAFNQKTTHERLKWFQSHGGCADGKNHTFKRLKQTRNTHTHRHTHTHTRAAQEPKGASAHSEQMPRTVQARSQHREAVLLLVAHGDEDFNKNCKAWSREALEPKSPSEGGHENSGSLQDVRRPYPRFRNDRSGQGPSVRFHACWKACKFPGTLWKMPLVSRAASSQLSWDCSKVSKYVNLLGLQTQGGPEHLKLA